MAVTLNTALTPLLARQSSHCLASWALLLRLPSRHQEIKFEHVGSRLGCATAPLEYRQPSPRSVLREPVMRTPSIRKYSSVLPAEVVVPRPPSRDHEVTHSVGCSINRS